MADQIDKCRLDLIQPGVAGMTFDELLEKPIVPVPAYKPSLRVIDNAQDIIKPKIGKPQVTVKIPIEHIKRAHFCCELCGQLPKFMCGVCKETYYCCEKHCMMDFHAIHKFVCVKLMIVRNPDVKRVQWRRFSKEEVAENIRMRKVILLNVANNMSKRYLIRGNYSFAIPCSLLAQKLVNEMHGLHCVQVIRPYLIMAEAYLARGKLERSKFYTGLINYIKMDKLNNSLPKEYEADLQRVLANQLIHEGQFDAARAILCSQFLQILSANLLREVTRGSVYLHQCIEEDLNPEVKLDKKLGLLQKPNCQWAHVMSEKDYEVYLVRETMLTYLRTIWVQFEATNRNDFPEIFPCLLYCVTMVLLVCRQWKEASDVYIDALAITPVERQSEFREMQSILGMLQKHIIHRTPVQIVSKAPEVISTADNDPIVDMQCAGPNRPIWHGDSVKFDAPDMPNEEDELGYTLQKIVRKIKQYKEEIKVEQDSAHINRKSHLRRIGLI
ncbi:hypothetical protein BV898_12724 [Hypsibius exemplaris]|uniref:MYND-type domain-containing protein n=1 Tax=Hypsibius exemplaris TaxID=2072580 RepID=A0A1W0WD29_HYPEX|nr:hypothetical protein BV898_12724 [Hypsibius exemplaris]